MWGPEVKLLLHGTYIQLSEFFQKQPQDSIVTRRYPEYDK